MHKTYHRKINTFVYVFLYTGKVIFSLLNVLLISLKKYSTIYLLMYIVLIHESSNKKIVELKPAQFQTLC